MRLVLNSALGRLARFDREEDEKSYYARRGAVTSHVGLLRVLRTFFRQRD